MSSHSTRIGFVVIGRNEGERLAACLRSLVRHTGCAVYVDSASSDDSVARARALGFDIVALDESRPLSAARARNAGLDRLLTRDPALELVQFVDGDTSIRETWPQLAAEELARRPGVAAVCGALEERDAALSAVRRLCQMEWEGEAGPVFSCGGIMMVRVAALDECGGFREEMIGGEEAELCRRLQAGGWSILRIEEAMGCHDSGLDTWRQWMRRATRGGYAYADAVALDPADGRKVRKLASSVILGGGLPLLFVGLVVCGLLGSCWCLPAALLALLPACLMAFRAYSGKRRSGRSRRDGALYASSCLLAKPCELCGAVLWARDRVLRCPPRWIEYKQP